MRRLVLISLLCLAFTPPIPKATKHKGAAVTQGMGAAKLIARIAAPPAPHTNTFAWQYPSGINPSNYFWNIESAISVKGPWTVLVTNASGAFEVTADRNQPLRIYRLSARLSQ